MPDPLVLIDSPRPDVAALTLNRPHNRNALSAELLESICRSVDDVQSDPATRVLILRGAGSVFCAGLDLKESIKDSDAEGTARLVARTLKTVYLARPVTIAAVQGAAAAGGAGLMSACDLVVAADDAKIGYPEVRRGLVAGLVMSFLYHQVGEGHARELALLGEFVDARRALDMGLVNRVVPAGQVMETAAHLALEVLKGGPNAVANTKQLICDLPPRTIDELLEHALMHHMAARRSDEAKEGLAAFVEKRAPKWEPGAVDGERGVG